MAQNFGGGGYGGLAQLLAPFMPGQQNALAQQLQFGYGGGINPWMNMLGNMYGPTQMPGPFTPGLPFKDPNRDNNRNRDGNNDGGNDGRNYDTNGGRDPNGTFNSHTANQWNGTGGPMMGMRDGRGGGNGGLTGGPMMGIAQGPGRGPIAQPKQGGGNAFNGTSGPMLGRFTPPGNQFQGDRPLQRLGILSNFGRR